MALPERIVKGLGDKPVSALGQGTVTIHTYIDSRATRLRLTNTLHVPEARENLLSLGRIDNTGGRIVCANGQMTMYDSTSNKIAVAHMQRSLYYLDVRTEIHHSSNIAMKIKRTWTWEEWHRRLGHIGITGLRKLHGKNLVDGFSLRESPQDFECEACIKSKIT